MTPILKQYLNLQELEAAAAEVLSPAAFAYYRGGANDEHTLRANRDGYAQLKLRPRMLVDVSNVDTSTEVLGVPTLSRWASPRVPCTACVTPTPRSPPPARPPAWAA